MSSYDLSGKVILITGASGGIGAASARMLITKGAKVTLVDLSDDAVTALAAQLPAGSSLPFAADVTDVDQMNAAVAATVAEFGRLDIVWANAGISNDPPVTLATADLATYERVIEVDLLGVIRTIKPALAQVIENKGQVVITGSGYSFLNAVFNSAYGASKAGVEMLARSLRAELAPHGASASVLYPSWTKTPITHSTQDDELLNRLFNHAFRGPLGMFSEPEVVAAGLVRGLQTRAPRMFAPRWWAAVSALRGIVNPLTDALLDRDHTSQDLIRQIERRHHATQI
ncbi:SDR family NAD(P)-dependent oxidoreductase [Mycobacterium vicinigordonae]|uniref:SDR family NAD(P)-dependent oxidoreductase n=1 Tax=Mycobacterium vicinigordonae TaxID=1719132 RepID=A0A7D6HXW2_9MYCO|nr:SDR family NAD(P)-dependent oxidoreductase [Mycobacterium vicinigordonae]QLL05354.1 SDR family NAD(P)-dependent oxidoreductase [Mycobacterium vicinigordonae]